MLTLKRLKHLIRYEPKTGYFFWNDVADLYPRAKSVCKKGLQAGSIATIGYRYISIDGGHYLAHRLAWFYMTGKWPSRRTIDHKNRRRLDNRWKNLREATQSQNMSNAKTTTHNRSGFKCVGWLPHKKKWRAYITHNYRFIHLGRFTSKKRAYEAYCAAAKNLRGEFARLK